MKHGSQKSGEMGTRHAYAGSWLSVLRLGWLPATLILVSCGKPPGDPVPDMSMVRGEPIEGDLLSDGADGSDRSGGAGGSDAGDAGWVVDEEGLIMVGFERLAGFEYEVSEDGIRNGDAGFTHQIPRAIRELDGREVGVRGFMLPMKVDGGLVREFLLMRDQSMCCFGVVPKINEWVSVTMAGRGVRAMMDQPVTVYGTLRVGEVYEQGVLAGLYQMNGTELAGALDL